MLFKKSETKKTIIKVFLTLVVLTALTGAVKLYHDSKYEKDEYARICPQNYGDPVSLDQCYWPYKFEGKTLDMTIKLEMFATLIAPLLLLSIAKML